MRRCNKCGAEKPLEEFYPNKESKGGRRATCISCVKQVLKQYRTTHRNELLKDKRSWYRQNKSKIVEKVKQWRIANPSKRQEQSRKYYKVHLEQIKNWHKKHDAEHPEVKRLASQRRRAKKKAGGGSVTVKEWREILEKYSHRCLGCGATGVKLEMDHVVPIALGGRHSADNIQPLCRACNAKKAAHIIDYRPGQGRIF